MLTLTGTAGALTHTQRVLAIIRGLIVWFVWLGIIMRRTSSLPADLAMVR